MRKVKRLSSVDLLPDELRDAINKAIREGRSTIDHILAHLETIAPAGSELPSRSAIGRYKKSSEEVLGARRESIEAAKLWAEELGQDPDSDVGRLLRQLLETVAFQELLKLGQAGDGADPKKIMMLSRSIKEMGQSKKTEIDIAAAERKEQKERAADAAAKAGATLKKAGVSPETIKLIETQILGIAKP